MQKIDYAGGIYLLEIELKKSEEITVGALGTFCFQPGYYYYCGSAQRGLAARIERHRGNEKKFHWHIDYLLARAGVINYFCWPVSAAGECRLAAYLLAERNGQVPAAGFGASDCNCRTHLIYFPVVQEFNKNEIMDYIGGETNN